jgi:UDP-3-O-[3-hydroxymyristoyl] glucosamine N-acyltransferase
VVQLGDIVKALGGNLHGNPQTCIENIAPLESAGPQDLSFLSHPKYQSQLSQTRAACVIVAPQFETLASSRGACIVADDPYLYFARLTQFWKKKSAPLAVANIHPSAVIHPDASIADTAVIGPLCVIERGAKVGEHSQLKSRVTLGEFCEVGQRCIVHPGVVIGADGFGFAPNQGTWEKIEQLGAVKIGNDVEIGANTCIDRGALQDTIIEDGVKLDNLIQIGHNVHIGKHTAMAGCVGVAGSARIGANCTVGGGAIILGHLSLVDGVHVSAASVVTRSIAKPGSYTGLFPIDDNATWEKNAASLKQLHQIRHRLKLVEAHIQQSPEQEK